MDVVEMIVPLAGLLVIYSLATCVVAIIIGKLVGYSPRFPVPLPAPV